MTLRVALRGVGKNPVFSALVIATMATGIGVNTAMFSLVQAVFLRPLDFPNQERLVTLWESDVDSGTVKRQLSPANFVDWQTATDVLESVGTLPNWTGTPWKFNVVRGGASQRVEGIYASSGFFDVLGVRPLLGRTFGPESDRHRGERRAVISWSLWREHFGGDSSVIGKTIEVDTFGGGKFTVIGVMPATFDFPRGARMWLSLADWGGGPMPSLDAAERCCAWYTTFARLKPGVSVEQASARLTGIARAISARHPEAANVSSVHVERLQETLAGSHRTLLLFLFGAVGCLLLIACSNVANLMLSRSVGRRNETLTRMALGASRLDLARQYVVESLVLTSMGALLGILLAAWSIEPLARILEGRLPLVERIAIDWFVLAFAGLLTIGCAVACGLVPLFAQGTMMLQQRSQAGSGQGKRVRQVLVVGEIALAVMLVATAGLLIRTLAKLQSVDVGFRVDHVLTASLDLTGEPLRQRGNSSRFVDELLRRVATLPGVQSVAAATSIPLQPRPAAQAITREGAAVRLAAESPQVLVTAVTPGYLNLMGIPLKQGRFCTDGDSAGGKLVAVLNETAARRYWPNENPVGKRFAVGSRERFGSFREVRSPDGVEWREIVGVVGDVRSAGYRAPIEPEVYFCHQQYPLYAPTLLVRTHGDQAGLASAIRGEINSASSRAVVEEMATLERVAAETVAEPRTRAAVVIAFSVLALLLGMLGIYGVMADAVARRTNEIGIRMALGARSEQVSRMFLAQGLLLTIAGTLIGLGGAVAVNKTISAFLFEVTAGDPVTLLGTVAVFVATSLGASLLPARRASRVDPVIALRSE